MRTDFYQQSGELLTLQIFVQPKSSRTGWGEVVERQEKWWIQLKISSPPVDGAANKEAIKYIAREFKTAKSNVRIIQGEKSKYKTLEITGADKDKLQAFLQANAPE